MKLFLLKLVFAGIFALPVVAFLDCGARRFDRMFPDAEGSHSSVWVRTTDVGPGDDLVVTVMTHTGYRSVIVGAHVQLGDAHLDLRGAGPTWGATISTKSSNEDDTTFVLPIPPTMPIGNTNLDLVIDLATAAPVSGGFETQSATDHLFIPIDILDPDAVGPKRLLDRLRAGFAWLVAFGLVYAAVRWRRRAASTPASSGRGNPELILLGLLLVVAVIAMIGELVFVRPIARSLAVPPGAWMFVLVLVWCAALGLGGWLGHRGRRYDARWRAARLRTIVGNGTGDAYREAALPPTLSRDVEPLRSSDIVFALRARNLDARRRRNRIDIATTDGLAIQLRASTWTPTTMQMTILDGYRPQTAVVVATLASLFGPIEYTSPQGTIVAYDSGGAITRGPLSDTVW